MFYLVKTPSWVKKIYPNYTWEMPKGNKVIYLTFDDGPHPEATTFVLDCLQQFNAKATFFCIGKNVQAHPAIYKRIIDDGHAVGNHTHHHLNGWKTKDADYLKDIEEASGYIHSCLFRPPYGRITRFQAQQLKAARYQFEIIMWTVLSGDFDPRLKKEKCWQQIALNIDDGSIVVFHDSAKAYDKLIYVLPKVLEHFTNQGYRFERLR
jgi:peptidoglycan/xylan/chitin deacetylase (PgdA/CDA1 family)